MEHKIIQTENYLLVVDENDNGDYGHYSVDIKVKGNPFVLSMIPDDDYRKVLAHLPLNNAPVLEGVDLLPELEKSFKSISHLLLKEIAALTFGYKEWIVSDISIAYHPYIAEHYEDAAEYFSMKFEGFFAGNNTAKYEVRLYPSMDLFLWYSYKEETAKILHPSNQSKVQELLQPYKVATKTYSEEDIRAAMMYGVHNHENVNEVTFNRFIQSLNQPAIPVGFKATMIGINKLGESNTLVFEAKKVKTIYNEQGIPVWQGEYIY